jgi:hypothetical protein
MCGELDKYLINIIFDSLKELQKACWEWWFTAVFLTLEG